MGCKISGQLSARRERRYIRCGGRLKRKRGPLFPPRESLCFFAAMAPRTSMLSIFLELATAAGSDPKDPAPWCYAKWMTAGSGKVPPFHPGYPAPEDPNERRHQEAMVDLVRRYRAAGQGKGTSEQDAREAILQGNVADAKARLQRWLDCDTKASLINSRFDRVLSDTGISVYTVALPKLTGVSTDSSRFYGGSRVTSCVPWRLPTPTCACPTSLWSSLVRTAWTRVAVSSNPK